MTSLCAKCRVLGCDVGPASVPRPCPCGCHYVERPTETDDDPHARFIALALAQNARHHAAMERAHRVMWGHEYDADAEDFGEER